MELDGLEQTNEYFEKCLYKYCMGQKVSMKEVDRAFREVKKEMRLVRQTALEKQAE